MVLDPPKLLTIYNRMKFSQFLVILHFKNNIQNLCGLGEVAMLKYQAIRSQQLIRGL